MVQDGEGRRFVLIPLEQHFYILVVSDMMPSGDSWSDTDFNPNGAQPSPSDPLGNPNYTPASVLAYGARWPVYLTITYNASLLETYCLAQSGAVVDSSITPHGGDFVHQVITFLSTYGDSNSGNWSAESTLFVAFFGVNDVNVVLPYKNSSAYLDEIFESYESNVEKVGDLIWMEVMHVTEIVLTLHQALQCWRS